jgi:pyruvate kinase
MLHLSTPIHTLTDQSVDRAIQAVIYLRDDAIALEQEFFSALQQVAPNHRESARNLIHYLAVRRHDLRLLQHELSLLGLSSLGRLEAHVLATLNSVLQALYPMKGQFPPFDVNYPTSVPFDLGNALLQNHSQEILGPAPTTRAVRIMVTMPSEAATDPNVIRNLLAAGMDIMRINCAHDHPQAWQQMVHHLGTAEPEMGKTCRICFDLAGPKLRTGAIEPGPEVVKWRPKRNIFGQVVTQAHIILTTEPIDCQANETILLIQGHLLQQAQPGDIIHLVDARGSHRRLTIQQLQDNRCDCYCDQTAYVTSGTPLELYRHQTQIAQDAIAQLPPRPQALKLSVGDPLYVTLASELGKPAVIDSEGHIIAPAKIGCTLEEAFSSVRVGDRIFFDDGKLAGIIREVQPTEFRVEITHAIGGSAKLKAEKGINLPDTPLNLPALTPSDRNNLTIALEQADMVSLSFVRRCEDIEQLLAAIPPEKQDHLGIILKIENQTAFNQLPKLLLTALRHPSVAVMVARGDLGVEVGFERLAEMQEEILWLCEAAHVPVIWATQVLESLAKGGLPSRAEVTDAAMGGRAECVMLNKGPYIEKTVQFLCDVLHRMQAHQQKKTAMLRKLHVSQL